MLCRGMTPWVLCLLRVTVLELLRLCGGKVGDAVELDQVAQSVG